jgi:AcrR family transcriptional regulator
MKPIPKPRKPPSQSRSQATVEAILAATARVLVARGYAGANTNAIADIAGVSVGSVYQYFPNKDALIAALHERHVRQLLAQIKSCLTDSAHENLVGKIDALIKAMIAAHRLEPDLHRVLEGDFANYDPKLDHNPADLDLSSYVEAMLAQHSAEIRPKNLKVATYTVLTMVEALVHGVVLYPPTGLASQDIEAAAIEAVQGYLRGGA